MTMSTYSLEIKQYSFHKSHWAEAQLPLRVGKGSPSQVLSKASSVSFAKYKRGSLWKDISCPSLRSCSQGLCLHWSLPTCKEQVMWLAPHSREGNGNPLQYSCLENPMDGGAWWAAVHGVPRSWTQLSGFTFTFMHWRRKWQPTSVFLPGESQGWGSLVGCRWWGRIESDTTEVT